MLNVTPDHLDRYPNVASYAAAKARIFARCDTAVINLDDPLVLAMPHAARRTLELLAARGARRGLRGGAARRQLVAHARAGEPLLALAAMRIKGLHNAANALAALALGEALELPLRGHARGAAQLCRAAAPLAMGGRGRGVRYIDDSKGTNVGATLAAVGRHARARSS